MDLAKLESRVRGACASPLEHPQGAVEFPAVTLEVRCVAPCDPWHGWCMCVLPDPLAERWDDWWAVEIVLANATGRRAYAARSPGAVLAKECEGVADWTPAQSAEPSVLWVTPGVFQALGLREGTLAMVRPVACATAMRTKVLLPSASERWEPAQRELARLGIERWLRRTGGFALQGQSLHMPAGVLNEHFNGLEGVCAPPLPDGTLPVQVTALWDADGRPLAAAEIPFTSHDEHEGVCRVSLMHSGGTPTLRALDVQPPRWSLSGPQRARISVLGRCLRARGAAPCTLTNPPPEWLTQSQVPVAPGLHVAVDGTWCDLFRWDESAAGWRSCVSQPLPGHPTAPVANMVLSDEQLADALRMRAGVEYVALNNALQPVALVRAPRSVAWGTCRVFPIPTRAEMQAAAEAAGR